MALVTKPPALDESINTTELSPRNVADVLAQELSGIATAISGGSDKAPKTDIATVEPTNVASRAYNIGELVYVNGNLYKVITAISGGATFTVGTNIQSANVSGAINDIPRLKVDELNSGEYIGSGSVTVSLSGNLSSYDAIVFEMFSGTRQTATAISPYMLFNTPTRNLLLTDVSDGATTGIVITYATDTTVTCTLVAGTARYIRIVGIKWR